MTYKKDNAFLSIYVLGNKYSLGHCLCKIKRRLRVCTVVEQLILKETANKNVTLKAMKQNVTVNPLPLLSLEHMAGWLAI